MHDALLRWVPWGLEIVLQIQRESSRILDVFFRIITDLGGPSLYVVTSVVFFWWIDKRLAARLAVLYLLSHYLNHWIKVTAAIERPFVVSTAVVQKTPATGYAFPSGHAQATTTLWLSWCLSFRRPWLWPLGGLMIVLVSFSRLYLGVHYPQDVVAGIILGATLTLGYIAAAPRIGNWLAQGPLLWDVATVLASTGLLIVLMPVPEAAIVAGAIGGLLTGYIVEVRWLDYVPLTGIRAAIGRIITGTTLVGVVFIATVVLLPHPAAPVAALVLTVIRFGVLGVAATTGAAWTFVRLGFARATR
ncbi:MAG: phosphatase PAP2 family protein [Anaerolineae bacterium]